MRLHKSGGCSKTLLMTITRKQLIEGDDNEEEQEEQEEETVTSKVSMCIHLTQH